MSNENKNATFDQQKRTDEKAQLSDEALDKVSGGGTPKQSAATKDTLPTETISLNYGKIEWVY